MPAPATKEQVLAELAKVMDPELKRDLVTLNMVQRVEVAGDTATVEVKLPARLSKQREAVRAAVRGAVEATGLRAEVAMASSLSGGEQPAAGGAPGGAAPALPGVRHVIAVGAGKGGVGKSTLALNLAVGLARLGRRAGILDGDIYGPSVPTMLGTDRYQVRASGKTLIPFELHGVKAMTIGALVDDDKPLIWRGPMAHGAFQQLATQTDWGELDELVVDLPPGTGDVPLTLSQTLPLTGAVIVCTPQKVAQDDAKRAIAMFRQLNVEVLGLVENMSHFVCDHGTEYDLFGRGGAELLATQEGIPFLGSLPIHPLLRVHGDAGDPSANFDRDESLKASLEGICRTLMDQVAVVDLEGAQGPTLTVR